MILNTGFHQHDAIRQFLQFNEVNENICVKVNFPLMSHAECKYTHTHKKKIKSKEGPISDIKKS